MGYGDRPLRVLFITGGFVLGFGLLYYLVNNFSGPNSGIVDRPSLPQALCYSLVSFTAVEYGNWVSTPPEWARCAGTVEATLVITSVALAAASFFR